MQILEEHKQTRAFDLWPLKFMCLLSDKKLISFLYVPKLVPASTQNKTGEGLKFNLRLGRPGIGIAVPKGEAGKEGPTGPREVQDPADKGGECCWFLLHVGSLFFGGPAT